MKTATITIAFEQEKLKALQFYAAKKDANPQDELDDFVQKLYEKYVPAQTREYIESRAEPTPPEKAHPVKSTKKPDNQGGKHNGVERENHGALAADEE